MKKLAVAIFLILQICILPSLHAAKKAAKKAPVISAPLGSHSVLETLSNLASASGALPINIQANSEKSIVEAQQRSAAAFSESLEEAIDLIQLPDLKRQLEFIRDRVDHANYVDEGARAQDTAREQKRIFRDVKAELNSLVEDYAERLKQIAKDEELGRLLMIAMENPDTIPIYIAERLKQADAQLAERAQSVVAENRQAQKLAREELARLEDQITERRASLVALTKKKGPLNKEVEELEAKIAELQQHEENLRSNLDQMRKLFSNGEVSVDFLGREVLDVGSFAAHGNIIFKGLQSQIVGVVEADLNVTHRLAEAIHNRKLEYRPNMSATFRFVNAEIVKRGYFRADYIRLTAFITVDFSWGFIHTYERSLPVIFLVDAKGRVMNDDDEDGPHAGMKNFLTQELPREYLSIVERIAQTDKGADFQALIAHCEQHLLIPLARALERPPEE